MTFKNSELRSDLSDEKKEKKKKKKKDRNVAAPRAYWCVRK